MHTGWLLVALVGSCRAALRGQRRSYMLEATPSPLFPLEGRPMSFVRGFDPSREDGPKCEGCDCNDACFGDHNDIEKTCYECMEKCGREEGTEPAHEFGLCCLCTFCPYIPTEEQEEALCQRTESTTCDNGYEFNYTNYTNYTDDTNFTDDTDPEGPCEEQCDAMQEFLRATYDCADDDCYLQHATETCKNLGKDKQKDKESDELMGCCKCKNREKVIGECEATCEGFGYSEDECLAKPVCQFDETSAGDKCWCDGHKAMRLDRNATRTERKEKRQEAKEERQEQREADKQARREEKQEQREAAKKERQEQREADKQARREEKQEQREAAKKERQEQRQADKQARREERQEQRQAEKKKAREEEERREAERQKEREEEERREAEKQKEREEEERREAERQKEREEEERREAERQQEEEEREAGKQQEEEERGAGKQQEEEERGAEKQQEEEESEVEKNDKTTGRWGNREKGGNRRNRRNRRR